MFFFLLIATKKGKNGTTTMFRTALIASSAELRHQSGDECEWQSALLEAQWDQTLPLGGELKVLDAWSRLLEGRCVGRLAVTSVPCGRVAAWHTVGAEGRLAADLWPRLGCVKMLCRMVSELAALAVWDIPLWILRV